ncbi:hypothetical protein [Leuconostoc falkenbergense]|uniref:hypothetical protein n=1 Tax=Leuconostoc falkenbergense TaxID=2766470 RepID=UPI0024A8985D|nr:hypothetical protein [Leuconostoc falkenbergense]MDI6553112.1 hypothetical protein [Leuconostoc falkenbergense]
MGLTFDEAIAKVGTYLKNNDLSNSENNDKFFYTILNDLRQEYAPTVEMTPRAYKFLKEEHNKFVKTGNDNFLSNNGLGNWRFYDEHKIDFDTDEEYIDQFTAEHNHFKGLTRTEVIQAWLHPETIKIVDE